MSSSERFGYEWDKYSDMDVRYEAQFRNWTNPLTEKDFIGKTVLDAGCGMGRNSYWPLLWGAASVTAFDLDSRSVNAAKETLARFPNAEVVQQSIYDIAWENKFDIAFSIGVIHHLKDPAKALSNMTRALKPGGRILMWVYSYEGNEWIVKFVNPIRKNITSKLPLGLVHIISYICSVPLYCFVKICKGPTGYLKQLSTFKFWHIHSIVFDQLIPDVANYWKKEEVEALFRELQLSQFTVKRPSNNMGWIAEGTK